MRLDFLNNKPEEIDEDYFGDYEAPNTEFNTRLPQVATQKSPIVEEDLARLLDDYNAIKKPRMTPVEGYVSPNTEPAIVEALSAPELTAPAQQLTQNMPMDQDGYFDDQGPAIAQQAQQNLPQTDTTVGLSPNEPQQLSKFDAKSRYEKLLDDYKNFTEAAKQRLASAEAASARGSMLSGFSEGLSTIADAFANRAGITNIKSTPVKFKQDYAKDLEARLKLDTDRFKVEREALSDMEKAQANAITNEINNLKLVDAKAAMDPNSPQSKAIRDAIESTFPDFKAKFKGDWEKQSAQSFEPLYKLLNLKESSEARVAAATALAGERKETKEEKAKDKKEREIETDTQKLSDKLGKAGLPNLLQNISAVEKELGMPLEEALKNKAEIPGYGRLEGAVSDKLVSDKARAFRQTVQTLLNTEISKQFGASQSAGEIARFAKQIGGGAFESEDAVIRGLIGIKRGAQADLKNVSAGFKDDVKSTYQERNPDLSLPSKSPELSEMDKKALEWANNNPNDPRATKIKQKLGM